MSIKKFWIPSVLALVASTSFCGASAHAQQPWTLQGKVISVSDGDTLMLLLDDHSKVSIRLSDIDAPESSHGEKRPGQPYSRVSTLNLTGLAKGRQATATCYEVDNPKYNRPVCTVFVQGLNVNAEQVKQGLAWANRANPRYVRDRQIYALEKDARAAGRGLWANTGQQAIEPWVWRYTCWNQKACSGSGQ